MYRPFTAAASAAGSTDGSTSQVALPDSRSTVHFSTPATDSSMACTAGTQLSSHVMPSTFKWTVFIDVPLAGAGSSRPQAAATRSAAMPNAKSCLMSAEERSIRGMRGRGWLLPLLLAAAAVAAPEKREGPRFVLEGEMTPAEADELARLLVAADKELTGYLRTKLPKGDRLHVTVHATAEGYRKACEEAGVATEEPALLLLDAAAIHVARQPRRYATRALILREWTRFHYERTRAKGREAAVPWYREGLAEFVAGHDWDGQALQLGIIPTIGADDLPGRALAATKRDGFDLAAVVDGSAPADRALAWALYAHITTGDKGKPLPKLNKFAPKMDGGVKTDPLFWQCFGKPEEYAPRFLEWLAASQQPFVTIEGDWEGLAPGRVRGAAEGIGACRTQPGLSEMKATILAPKGRVRWRAGAVLSYAGEKDYALFLVDWAGYLNIFRLVDGRQKVIEQGPGPGPSDDGAYRIHLFRKGGKVYLMFEGGASYGPWELPGDGFGLAVEGCDLAFADIWRK